MTFAVLEDLVRHVRRSVVDAPERLDPRDVTVVVPVRDDQRGLNRLVRAVDAMPDSCRPSELVIVDDASRVTLQAPADTAIRTTVLRSDGRGPAAARNLGWRAARSEWILFLDADCVPTSTLLDDYARAMNGAVGYAGIVHAYDDGLIPRYYDTQQILVPPPTRHARPQYLVTANALVWRRALELVDGFDATFPLAAGEDIDLAIRLARVGELSFAPDAVVLHEFGTSIHSFARRFVRYGIGNRLIADRYDVDMTPRPFRPAVTSVANWTLAAVQVAAMRWGYSKRVAATRVPALERPAVTD
ncbi:MAG: glycosyltransferase [Polyangiales bacterium]